MELPPTSRAFDKAAGAYDAWYEGNTLFSNELRTLHQIPPPPARSLEVGVGSGRFAQALGIKYGLDPAPRLLAFAYRRGVMVVQGKAEALPVHSSSLAAIYFLFSLCFVQSVEQALSEAIRALRPGGRLIAGFIPRESAWGRHYEMKKLQGHPIYRHATFLRPADIHAYMSDLGLRIRGGVSTLFHGPHERPYQAETPVPEI